MYPENQTKVIKTAEKSFSSAKAWVDEGTCHNVVVIVLAQDMLMTALFCCQMLSANTAQQNVERKQVMFRYSNEM